MKVKLIEDELKEIDFGDKRLDNRLIKIATKFYNNSEASIPEACGSWNETKAAYRFFNNQNVKPTIIYESHKKATLKRIEKESIILIAQDKTSFNFTSHKNTDGMGPISASNRGTTGFLMHSGLAISTKGVPLGLLSLSTWSRDPIDFKMSKEQRQNRPIETKESYSWIEHLEKNQKDIPDSIRTVTIADRESDIYDLFVAAKKNGQDILIRAKNNRPLINSEKKILDAVKDTKILGETEIKIFRTQNTKERKVNFTIQTLNAEIVVPARRKKEKFPNVKLNIIYAKEKSTLSIEETSKKEDCLEWFLLTTLPLNNITDAEKYLKWYSYRWKIERFHYTLKSGCNLEKLELETKERLERALSVYVIVAFILLWLTHEARENPDDCCSKILTQTEWQTLYIVIHKEIPPDNPPNLKQAVKWIAQLGGFLGRRSDGDPGVKVLWRGLTRLQDHVNMKNCLDAIKTYG